MRATTAGKSSHGQDEHEPICTWCLLGGCTAAAKISLWRAGPRAASMSTRDMDNNAERSWPTAVLSFSRVTEGCKEKRRCARKTRSQVWHAHVVVEKTG